MLGIITARGGSKGIPKKNLVLLAGKPLIAYTIEAAKNSGVFDRIIVSTDSEDIARVAKEYGAEVPFMRPPELALDTTPTLPVLVHAVEWLRREEGYDPDAVAILQPTAPLRTAKHLKEAYELFMSSGADSVVSVTEVPGHHSPHWQFNIDQDNKLELFTLEPFSKIIRRRQDLPKTYSRDGAIYMFKTKLLFDADPSFYGNDVRAYVLDEKSAVNIDTPLDLQIAEQYLKER